MNPLEHFNLVYGSDARVLDPSVEVNAVTGVGVQPHLEPFHTVKWVMGELDATSSVLADDKAMVFRGHKTERMIPHLPLPPWPVGPALVKTIVADSKCQIACYHPDLLVEGRHVGIALVLLAPPLHCASLSVPGLDKIGKGVGKALGKGLKGLGKALEGALPDLDKVGAGIDQAIDLARSVQDGVEAVQEIKERVESLPEMRELESRLDRLWDRARDLVESYHLALIAARLIREEIAELQEARKRRAEQVQKHKGEKQKNKEKLDWLRCQGECSSDAGNKTPPMTSFQLASENLAILEAQRRIHAKALHDASVKKHKKSKEIQSLRKALKDNERKRASLSQSIRHRKGMKAGLGIGSTGTLGIMMPSLTSFGLSFWQHSVKVGMNPASFANMWLHVAAIVAADLVDEALGLVGDALVAGMGDSKVASWVAELAAGVLQGLVGSPLHSWGESDTLDFSVPISSGPLLGEGAVQAKAEFRWRLVKQEGGAGWVQQSGARVGLDLPGTHMDQVQVITTQGDPALQLEMPEIW